MSSSASSSSSGVPPTIASPLFKLHHFARTDNPAYPKRQPVPDDKVHWSVEWKEYAPKDFTSEGAAKKPVLSRQKVLLAPDNNQQHLAHTCQETVSLIII